MAKVFKILFTGVFGVILTFFFLFGARVDTSRLDCPAGCSFETGFPFSAMYISRDGISPSPKNIIDVVFPFIKTVKQIYIVGFFADLFIAGLIIVLVYKFLAWIDNKLF